MLLVVWCIGGQNLLQEVKHNLPKGDLQSNCCIGSAAMRMAVRGLRVAQQVVNMGNSNLPSLV